MRELSDSFFPSLVQTCCASKAVLQAASHIFVDGFIGLVPDLVSPHGFWFVRATTLQHRKRAGSRQKSDPVIFCTDTGLGTPMVFRGCGYDSFKYVVVRSTCLGPTYGGPI